MVFSKTQDLKTFPLGRNQILMKTLNTPVYVIAAKAHYGNHASLYKTQQLLKQFDQKWVQTCYEIITAVPEVEV